jgi:hypothetical protein
MHHTRSQEETPVVKLEDPEGGIPQVPRDEEQDVEFQSAQITGLARSKKANPGAL